MNAKFLPPSCVALWNAPSREGLTSKALESVWLGLELHSIPILITYRGREANYAKGRREEERKEGRKEARSISYFILLISYYFIDLALFYIALNVSN